MTEQEQPVLPTEDFEIILLGLGVDTYYLFKGEQHLNEMLLADGDYPAPVCCLRFDSIFDMKMVLGETASVSQCWVVHPAVVARLREDGQLIETDA